MGKRKRFLHEYLNAYAPVAQETEGQLVWTEYLKPYVDFMKQDAYGTSYGIIRGTTGSVKNKNKVVIEAH
jgi:putative aminopeptidase FrvX